ncbi:MAG: hypothetical protein A2Y30_01330 [Spirochaetes bacterium GWE1_32_154]|nr:MAG: hypothetical protein A2Y30_01330 [Spirochaetes bacterium GWE1_32_154]
MKKKNIVGILLTLILITNLNLMILLKNSHVFDFYVFITSHNVLDKLFGVINTLCFIISPIVLLISLYEKIKIEKYNFLFLKYVIINVLLIFTIPLTFIVKFKTISVDLFVVPIMYLLLFCIFSLLIIQKMKKKI